MNSTLKQVLWPSNATRAKKWIRGFVYGFLGFIILGFIVPKEERDAQDEESNSRSIQTGSSMSPSESRTPGITQKWSLSDAYLGMGESEFVARCKENDIRIKKVVSHTTQGIGSSSLYMAGQNWLGNGGSQYHFSNGSLISIGKTDF